jgi:hypothetical protein
MAITGLGQGKGRYIVSIAYVSQPSENVVKFKPLQVKFEDGTKVTMSPFACETAVEAVKQLQAMAKFIKTSKQGVK